MTPEARYEQLVKVFLGKPGVNQEVSTALRVRGRIFAMLSARGEFVVKLPRSRVDELIESGDGHRFDPGHGRVIKEWLALRRNSSKDWMSLASEARDSVASTPK